MSHYFTRLLAYIFLTTMDVLYGIFAYMMIADPLSLTDRQATATFLVSLGAIVLIMNIVLSAIIVDGCVKARHLIREYILIQALIEQIEQYSPANGEIQKLRQRAHILEGSIPKRDLLRVVMA